MFGISMYRSAVTLAVFVVLLAMAGPAGAATICVGSSPTFPTCPRAATTGDLRDAVFEAVGGPDANDTVVVGAGTFSFGSGDDMNLTIGSGTSLRIVGQGPSTVIAPQPGQTAFTITTASPLEISSMALSLPQTAGGSASWALALIGPDAEIKDVIATVPRGANYGAILDDGASIKDSKFVIGGGSGGWATGVLNSDATTISGLEVEVAGVVEDSIHGVRSDAPLTVERSSFTGSGAAPSAIDMAQGEPLTVRGSRFSGFERPLVTDRADLSVYDTLVDLGAASNAEALRVTDGRDPGGPAVLLIADGVTILGAAGANGQVGVHAISNNEGRVKPTITNSLISLKGNGAVSFFCDKQASIAMETTLSHSLFSAPIEFTAGGCAWNSPGLSMIGNPSDLPTAGSNLDPMISSDGVPLAGSPLIDAGDPATVTIARALDLVGAGRLADGNKDGSSVIDAGAGEYSPPAVAQPPLGGGEAPSAVVPPTFSKATGTFRFKRGAKLRNGFTVSKKKPKGAHFKVTNATAAVKLRITLSGAKGKQLKGSQTLSFPAGTSYLTFGGKWNKKPLAGGTYRQRLIDVDSGSVLSVRPSMRVSTPKRS